MFFLSGFLEKLTRLWCTRKCPWDANCKFFKDEPIAGAYINGFYF